MERLIEILYSHIMNGKRISDDLMYEFSQHILKIVQGIEEVEPVNELFAFRNYVEMYWRGGKFETEKKGYFAFQMGQLLSYINMLKDIEEIKKQELNLEEYASRWEKRFSVFKSMHEEKGITHKKLADLSGLSPSSLSQFIAKTKWDGYFVYRIAGREKYYYLTEKGEKLYDYMEEKRRVHFDGKILIKIPDAPLLAGVNSNERWEFREIFNHSNIGLLKKDVLELRNFDQKIYGIFKEGDYAKSSGIQFGSNEREHQKLFESYAGR